MKKIFIIILLFITAGCLYSQQNYQPKNVHSNFWSFGVDGGATIPLGTFKDSYKPGGNAGIEVSYNPSRRFAVFTDIQINFLSAKDTSFTGASSYIEGTLGIRYYLGKGPVKFFGEAALGDYIYDYSLVDLTGNITSYTKHNIGINGGAGVDFSASARTALFIKAKFHNIFTIEKSTNYIGLYAGLKYII